ncbi:MAG: methyltransferase domain-containing protein [Acidimicrobiales bacterium]
MSDPASGDPRIHRAAADGFGRGAADYERARPSYPAAAVDLIVEGCGLGPGRTVVDVAAGTGKMTRLLVPCGAEVLAVEPVAEMRAELERVVPRATVLDGTAEALPLADAAVDALTVAQAFHWFEAATALAECHRVLRLGGWLVLVWNVRDASVDWVARFGELLVEGGGAKPYEEGVDWAAVVADHGGFTVLEEHRFANLQEVTVDELVARAASTSFVSALPDDERAACLARVRALAATHPDLAGRDRFVFPHETVVYRSRRR